MKWLDKFRQIYKQYFPLSNYVLALLLLLPLYPFLRHVIIHSNFPEIYASWIRQGSVYLGMFLGCNKTILINIFLSPTLLDSRFMAFWQMLLFLLGSIFFHASFRKRLLIAIFTLFGVYLFNVIRWLLFSYGEVNIPGFSYNLWNSLLIVVLNFILLLFYIWWWKQNFPLKRLLIDRLNFSVYSIRKVIRNLIIVAILIILTQFVTHTQIVPLISVISKAVLYLSHVLLAALGYPTYLWGRYIYTSEAAIFFSDTCAGIELMLIYASFIGILNGKYKLWFIAGGVLVIFLMNVLRISFIMIYLIRNHGHYSLPIDIHDLYTYPVYVVTFILWVTWMHFFNKS